VPGTGNEQVVGRTEGAQAVACPKCGSGRTNVTVNVVDEAGLLTLYSCSTCEHRFSRSRR